MKKLLVAIVCAFLAVGSFAADPGEVNEKVLKVFKETFKDVRNEEWYQDGDQFTVRFVRNEIDTRITYDEEANILSTIRYYKGKNLPAMILGKLNRKYKDKSVFGVTETSNDNGTEYHITLEDKENWMVVVSDASGSMHVEKKFKKA